MDYLVQRVACESMLAQRAGGLLVLRGGRVLVENPNAKLSGHVTAGHLDDVQMEDYEVMLGICKPIGELFCGEYAVGLDELVAEMFCRCTACELSGGNAASEFERLLELFGTASSMFDGIAGNTASGGMSAEDELVDVYMWADELVDEPDDDLPAKETADDGIGRVYMDYDEPDEFPADGGRSYAS